MQFFNSRMTLNTNAESARSGRKRIHVAVIGAGVRSASYLRNIPAALRDRVELVAIADSSASNRKLMKDRFAAGKTPAEFEDGADLLKSATFDALIIGSYNNTHADFTISALDTGASILLEKPVATTVEQCRRLWAKFQTVKDPQVFVGFVLRYTPFYQRIAKLLKEGSIGQLMAIDADENISQSITSAFYRGWRRDDDLSGGFMVEKCSHDFDIFSMLTGQKVQRVFSMARRTHFIDRPRHEQHRRFDASLIRNLALDYGDVHTKRIFENTQDIPIYGAESDVPDHQAVMMELEDGVLINFMACLGQPRTTRRIKLFGSNGSVEGDIDRGFVFQEIPFEEKLGAQFEEHPIGSDDSGHHGADSVINDAFWASAAGMKSSNLAGVAEGIEAVLTGIAAEESKRTGLPVEVEPLRKAVYGSASTPLVATA